MSSPCCKSTFVQKNDARRNCWLSHLSCCANRTVSAMSNTTSVVSTEASIPSAATLTTEAAAPVLEPTVSTPLSTSGTMLSVAVSGSSAETDSSSLPVDITEPPDVRIKELKKRQTSAASSITKKRNELDQLLQSEDTLHLVKDGLTELNHLYDVYAKCHSALVDEISLQDLENTETLLDSERKRYEDRQSATIQFRSVVQNWISQTETNLADKLSSSSRTTLHSSLTVFLRENRAPARYPLRLHVPEKMSDLRSC